MRMKKIKKNIMKITMKKRKMDLKMIIKMMKMKQKIKMNQIMIKRRAIIQTKVVQRMMGNHNCNSFQF